MNKDPERPRDYLAPAEPSEREVRYSYIDMMQEVEEERAHSVVGRELIDAVEINQIFARRGRKIRKS
jgi:hypothetical protein